jgi:hypothetical protein
VNNAALCVFNGIVIIESLTERSHQQNYYILRLPSRP